MALHTGHVSHPGEFQKLHSYKVFLKDWKAAVCIPRAHIQVQIIKHQWRQKWVSKTEWLIWVVDFFKREIDFKFTSQEEKSKVSLCLNYVTFKDFVMFTVYIFPFPSLTEKMIPMTWTFFFKHLESPASWHLWEDT